MHGDFLAETRGERGKLIGGLALLSGYINKVRKEEKNVLYLISGDMVQGSLIDSEYKGISTIEIMNFLSPDVVTLGNHELDYGLPHLLFLERLANFPIVNANMYIKKYHRRIMKPYVILERDGFDILFIGIITDTVMKSIQKSSDIATFMGLEDAAGEVGKICNAYRDGDIDLTILLTHIGIEEDKKLASMLNPDWGVDMIIGGHSHTILRKPEEINGILIAQAGTGTDQVGRFDIVVDDESNSIVSWEWKLVPIEEGIALPDPGLTAFIESFKGEVDKKYNTILCRFERELTHNRSGEETELGNLFTDILEERSGADFVLLGSASIRGVSGKAVLGPVVTLKDFTSAFPYDDALFTVRVSGAQLKRIFSHILRKENRNEDGETYQVSGGAAVSYDDSTASIRSLLIGGADVENNRQYTIGLLEYDCKNSEKNLSIPGEELSAPDNPRVIATSVRDILEEYLRRTSHIDSRIEGRIVVT
jgi:5'-nucleotidase